MGQQLRWSTLTGSTSSQTCRSLSSDMEVCGKEGVSGEVDHLQAVAVICTTRYGMGLRSQSLAFTRRTKEGERG